MPKFKASTELVLVPAVVTDKSGNHVAGLKKEEFLLEEDGKQKAISVFEEVTTDGQRFHRLKGQEGQFSNFEETSGPYHRLSIIVLDLINTPFSDLSRAQDQIIQFLTQAAESGEPICLLTLTEGGIHLVQNFTDDPKVLAEALRHLRRNQPPAANESLADQSSGGGGDRLQQGLEEMIRGMIQSARSLDSIQKKNTALMTVSGLEQVARAFGPLPGRKALIWATSGFSYSLSPPNLALCEPACPVHQRSEVQAAYERLWQTLNDAQMAIYAVDLRGLTTNNFTASNGSDMFTRPHQVGDRDFDHRALEKWSDLDFTDTMQIFSDKTGGKMFRHGNDLMRDFREAVDDDSKYYVLGYYVDRNKLATGWHKLSVRLSRRGTSVRYRRGFFLNKPSAGLGDDEIRLALLSPLDFTGIPLTVTWTGKAASFEPDKSRMTFDLLMSPAFAFVDESANNHLVVDITAVAIDKRGHVGGQTSQTVDLHLNPDSLEQIRLHGMTFRSAIPLPPGDYTVRFAVRDALADRVGSLSAPLSVAGAVLQNAQSPVSK